MWDSIAQSGLASVGVDFMESLFLLVAGLVWRVWLSAGLIAVLAVHHHWSLPQPQTRLSGATSDAVDHQEGRNEVALHRRTGWVTETRRARVSNTFTTTVAVTRMLAEVSTDARGVGLGSRRGQPRDQRTGGAA